MVVREIDDNLLLKYSLNNLGVMWYILKFVNIYMYMFDLFYENSLFYFRKNLDCFRGIYFWCNYYVV